MSNIIIMRQVEDAKFFFFKKSKHSEKITVVKIIYYLLLGKSNLIFLLYGQPGKLLNNYKIIIIILSIRVGTSKNKKLIIEVTHESKHICLIHDSTMSSALNFCFLSTLL